MEYSLRDLSRVSLQYLMWKKKLTQGTREPFPNLEFFRDFAGDLESIEEVRIYLGSLAQPDERQKLLSYFGTRAAFQIALLEVNAKAKDRTYKNN